VITLHCIRTSVLCIEYATLL